MFIWLNASPIESTKEGHVRATTRTNARCEDSAAALFQRRRKIDEDLAALAPCAEFEMRERRGCEVGGPMGTEILLGDAAEEAVYEFARERAFRNGEISDRVRDYLFDEREAGGRNLAEHGPTLCRRALCGRGHSSTQARAIIHAVG